MFRFDYSLIRDEGREKYEYKPNGIPQELKNLVCIKAPNSTGKSTLLNIIALGLLGKNNKKIDPAIKKKLDNLSDVKHQVLNAEFTIDNKNGNLELKSKIVNGKPTLIKFINGKEQTLSSDRFENDYNLIYDIPTNPTERLKELTSEIEIYQERVGNQILRFSDYLSKIHKEISDSQDPKKVIQYKNDISNLEENLKQLSSEKNDADKKYNILKRFCAMKYYIFYRDKIREIETRIRKITGQQSEIIEKKKRKRFVNQKTFDIIRVTISKINATRENLTKDLDILLPKENKKLKLWREYPELDFEKIEEYVENFDEGLSLKKLSIDFKSILEKELDNPKYITPIREYEIYREIIKFFEGLKREYKDEEIIIPGVDKSIQDFIDILIDKNRENTKIYQKVDLMKNCIRQLSELENNIDILKNTHFIEFEKQKEPETKDIDDSKKMNEMVLETYYLDMKKYHDKKEKYNKELLEFKINPQYIDNEYQKLLLKENFLKSFNDYTEQQLNTLIEENEKKIKNFNENINSIKGELEYKKKELSKLEQKKIHRFHNDADIIDQLAKVSRKLAQQFLKNYSNYLKNLKEQSPEKIAEDKEQMRYYKELGSYFGKKLHQIFYNGIIRSVDFVDLIQETIHMDDGLIERFEDFGTGESQAAYLKSVIETSQNDKRKLIVLFDEVGMIDDIRLKQVTDSLKKLYEEEKLLLGIIVQKGQNVEIIDLI